MTTTGIAIICGTAVLLALIWASTKQTKEK